MAQIRTPHVVAEIGGNHRGDFNTAKEMIMVAAQFCKANVVKFQKRNPKECLSPEEYNAPHPNPSTVTARRTGRTGSFLSSTWTRIGS